MVALPPWKGHVMADEPDALRASDGSVVQRLVKETGITEAEARELIALLRI